MPCQNLKNQSLAFVTQLKGGGEKWGRERRKVCGGGQGVWYCLLLDTGHIKQDSSLLKIDFRRNF